MGLCGEVSIKLPFFLMGLCGEVSIKKNGCGSKWKT
jgi:hypothetical protein